jgi:hypothetical protein
MELIEHARKGNIVNIKENYYIYKFKQLEKLIVEQKSTKDNDNQNGMFDIALRHECTPTKTSQGTGIQIPHTTHQTAVLQHTVKGEAAQQQR